MALCVLRDRWLIPRWMAACSWCPAGWLGDVASGMACLVGLWGGQARKWHVPRGRREARQLWDALSALSRGWAGREYVAAVSMGSKHFPIQNLRLRAGRGSGTTQSNLSLSSGPPFPYTGDCPLTNLRDRRDTTHKPLSRYRMALKKFFLIWSEICLCEPYVVLPCALTIPHIGPHLCPPSLLRRGQKYIRKLPTKAMSSPEKRQLWKEALYQQFRREYMVTEGPPSGGRAGVVQAHRPLKIILRTAQD